MDRTDVPVEHDLVGIVDGGFGEQAYCSCGWRTAPKESSWEAGVVWHTHMTTSTVDLHLIQH